jgi:hypothetical protein
VAVGFRSATDSGNTVSVTGRGTNVPAGAAVDDIAVISLCQWESATPTVTPPSGFTQKGATWSSQDGMSKNSIWWKRLTAADAGTYDFTWTGGSMWTTVQCALFTGCITTGDPWDAVATPVVGTWGTITTMSVTLSDAGGGMYWAVYNDTAGTHTPPTSFTELAEADCGTSAYRIPGASGSQSAANGSISSSSSSGAWLGALLPAGGGGGAGTSHPLRRDLNRGLILRPRRRRNV